MQIIWKNTIDRRGFWTVMVYVSLLISTMMQLNWAVANQRQIVSLLTTDSFGVIVPAQAAEYHHAK